MQEIKTEIIIAAPLEMIWETLMDFDNYQFWNPMIYGFEGEVKKGEKVKMIVLANSRKITIPIEIKNMDIKTGFSWTVPKRPLLNLLVDAEHYFEIVNIEDGKCRLIHGEKFSGILPFLGWFLIQRLAKVYSDLNLALKDRVEFQNQ